MNAKQQINTHFDNYRFGFKTDTNSIYESKKGLTQKTVKDISNRKNEPEWMLSLRLNALKEFERRPMPKWGPDLKNLDFLNTRYFVQATKKVENSWDSVPSEIKDTFEKLGVPQFEKKHLSGSGAQFESEMVYHSLKTKLEKKGVLFDSTDNALRKYPEIFKKYFGKLVPLTDNKFAALNTAVWSGGTFIYIPKNVNVDLPLQAYFRINTELMGQFERTLIIADEGSSLHYIEGCTAPIWSKDSLHAAVVEIYIHKNAKVKYTTVQNWSKNVYNLVTKRAFAYENSEMFWLDCNLGSKKTMKYPAVYLLGENAKAEVHSFAFAGKGQDQDTGTRIIHSAKNTTSNIISKSISKKNGKNSFRAEVKINKGAKNSKSKIECSALLLDQNSVSNTYPDIKINENKVAVAHEATVSRISREQMFYLMSRGLSEEESSSMIVNGFADPIVQKLPMEYAVELNRLIDLELTDAIG